MSIRVGNVQNVRLADASEQRNNARQAQDILNKAVHKQRVELPAPNGEKVSGTVVDGQFADAKRVANEVLNYKSLSLPNEFSFAVIVKLPASKQPETNRYLVLDPESKRKKDAGWWIGSTSLRTAFDADEIKKSSGRLALAMQLSGAKQSNQYNEVEAAALGNPLSMYEPWSKSQSLAADKRAVNIVTSLERDR
jgi:hypothetical protein